MKLITYYKQLNAEQKRALAKNVGTSLAYLRHLAHGRKMASHKLVKKIVTATDGKVTRQELRPDIYG
ncbi:MULTISPECIES: transcriptional regulator [unclassified Endozoicomonas]|uniref:transcriptional regulator n=1 Tax=unclassified Endozoicomonas TaxID=2644528 RepID=UPI003BB601A1